MDVMRGQIFNLREALRTHKSPVGLVQMPPQMMVEVIVLFEGFIYFLLKTYSVTVIAKCKYFIIS
jgi:hypothetical protein